MFILSYLCLTIFWKVVVHSVDIVFLRVKLGRFPLQIVCYASLFFYLLHIRLSSLRSFWRNTQIPVCKKSFSFYR